MPIDSALLAGVPLFEFLNETDRRELANQLETVHCPAGRLLFNCGDPGDSLFIIRSGEVEIFFKDNTGHRIVLEVAGPGAVFGELSLLDNGPRAASALVTQDLEAFRLDRDHLERFLRLHPAAAMNLLSATGRRLRQTTEQLRHTASRNVNAEVAVHSTWAQRAADKIAQFSGSIPFLMIHAVGFATWIGVNTGLVPSVRPFDPFPFGLLTMAVSLEAIMLTVIILLSQNRQAAKDRIRADVEYDVNLKAELEIAHLHEKLDHLHGEVLGRLEALARRLKP